MFGRKCELEVVDDPVYCRGGMGIAHHAIGSSYYFNTFRYLPMPYVGYEGILYLLQELGLAMEDMFHERGMEEVVL